MASRTEIRHTPIMLCGRQNGEHALQPSHRKLHRQTLPSYIEFHAHTHCCLIVLKIVSVFSSFLREITRFLKCIKMRSSFRSIELYNGVKMPRIESSLIDW